jgi:MerR family transcriptional regulator, light-induced transcriptional regulator
VADERAGSGEHTDLLTLQEAADALKVHYMTAYRWVRRGELPAFKAGGRLRVRRSDLEDFVAARAVDTALPAGDARRTDWPVHVERLHALLAEGAAADAGAMVRKVIADGAPVGDVYLRLLTPALHRIGEDWETGRLGVAEEHRATAIVNGIMARLAEHFRRRGPARGTVVTVTPPDETHGVAAAMAADFLRAGGFDVHHLGTDVPVADLRRFVTAVHPTAVVISVTRPDLPREVLADVVEAASASNGVLPVLGGQGIDPATAERLGAAHAEDLAELVGLLSSEEP